VVSGRGCSFVLHRIRVNANPGVTHLHVLKAPNHPFCPCLLGVVTLLKGPAAQYRLAIQGTAGGRISTLAAV
jgi:hypothetical protein